MEQETNNEVPAVIKPKVTDLYRALKLASELSSRCHFSSYDVDRIKDKPADKIDDYTLDTLFKELLFAEAHLQNAQRAIEVAKAQVLKVQGSKLFEDL